MSKLIKLVSCNSVKDLAGLISISPGEFVRLLKADRAAYYKSFVIPKKSGGTREIHAPYPRLKIIQRRLSDLLSDCLTEIELKQANKNCILSHGFKQSLSIITNAKPHQHKRFVINVDIENYFHSFNFGRVLGFF